MRALAALAWVTFFFAAVLAPARASAQLDQARHLYDEAEFDQALAALERAASGDGLSIGDAVSLLELRAELHLALGATAEIDRDLVQLLTLAPDHTLDPHRPPELHESFARARAALGPPLAIEIETIPREGALSLHAGVSHDPGGVVRELRVTYRRDGGPWEVSGPSMEVEGASTVDVAVAAIGPGGAVLATEGTQDAPRSFVVPGHAATGGAFDGWVWVGVGIGVAVAVVAAIIIGVVVSSPSESDRTQPGTPTVTPLVSPLTMRF